MMRKFQYMNYNFVSIEGNIGSGKTSLAKKITNDFNAEIILEAFANNPFLPKFYQEPEKYAFSLELFFMAERYSQLKDKWSDNIFHSIKVSDYFFMKSKIFAQNNLNPDELSLFNKLFEIMMASLPKPDLLIYLYADTARLQQNIKIRNRDFEKNISNDYLERIQAAYLDYLHKQKQIPVLILDVGDSDFVKDISTYNKIKDLLKNKYRIGVTNEKLD